VGKGLTDAIAAARSSGSGTVAARCLLACSLVRSPHGGISGLQHTPVVLQHLALGTSPAMLACAQRVPRDRRLKARQMPLALGEM
jgi:hypothetical protein